MRHIGKRALTGFLVGSAVALLSVGAWAEHSPNTETVIAAHRRAAEEARQKVVFHEGMEKSFKESGAGKFDMAGHCRHWADVYRKLAVEHEKAARDLEEGP